MKYLRLRRKGPDEKDLETKRTYKKQRLYEVQEKEQWHEADLIEDQPEIDQGED